MRISNLLILAGIAALAFPAAHAGTVCDGAWHTDRSENPKSDYGDYDALVAVQAYSATDALAIGITRDFDLSPPGFRTLVERWDGAKWSRVHTPNSKHTTWDVLSDLVVISPDDAWAVGTENFDNYKDLVLHWDGSSWTIQDDGTTDAYLTSVTATGPNDVWAAGSTNYIGRGLVMHWDGSSWTETHLGGAIVFRDIQALSPTDVWAVGQESVNYFGDLTIAFHYDGVTWKKIPTPSPLQRHDEDQNWLTSIAVVAPDDIWVTGVTRDHDWGIFDSPFLLHWDGAKWSHFDAPDPDGRGADTDLWSAVALGPDDVWAVGSTGNEPDWSTFTVHWDGVAWTQVAPSAPGRLVGLAWDTAGGLLGVGDRESSTYIGISTLAQHLCH